ncbi:MAG: hypothetical protein Q9222_000264 [Ikaeria aurantiellina]
MDDDQSQSRSQWPFGCEYSRQINTCTRNATDVKNLLDEEYSSSAQQTHGPAPAPAPGQSILAGHEQQDLAFWIHTVGSDLQPADEGLLYSPAGLSVVGGSSNTISDEALRYEGFQSYRPSSFESGVPNDGYYHAAEDDHTIAPSSIFHTTPRHLSPASFSYSNVSMHQPRPDITAHTSFGPGRSSNYSRSLYQPPTEIHLPNGYYPRDLPHDPVSFSFPMSEASHAGTQLPSALATRSHPALNQNSALHFGSDPNFGQRTYTVPRGQYPAVSTQNSLLQQLSPVNNDSEANDIQKTDPTNSQNQHRSSRQTSLDALPPEASTTKADSIDRDKSWRRSLTQGTEDALTEPSPSSRPKNAKKRNKERVCLTDEQKRNNHKKSEQNRRDLINHWQGKMEALVPGINDKKLYKAGKLDLAVRWLESIHEDNHRMAAYLDALNQQPA